MHTANGFGTNVPKTHTGEKTASAGCWWLTLVIPATQEAEIRRIEV
jgi:hypothetical protein